MADITKEIDSDACLEMTLVHFKSKLTPEDAEYLEKAMKLYAQLVMGEHTHPAERS
jgi:hypothetical protein